MGAILSSAAVSDAAMLAALCHHFGLERTTACVLMALYRNDGRAMSADQLGASAFSTAVAMRSHHIVALRQALDSEAIDWEPKMGYRLTESGMDECRAALWMMGEELRRAS